LIASVLYNYTGKIYFEADNRLHQDGVSVVNGSLEYWATSHWGVALFADNLTDARYYIEGNGGSTADAGQLAPPRTFGVNFKFDY